MIHTYYGSLIINGKCHFSFKIKIKLLTKLFFSCDKEIWILKNHNYKLHVISLRLNILCKIKKKQAKYSSVIIFGKKYFTMGKNYDNFFS